jgi:hypothetical protein
MSLLIGEVRRPPDGDRPPRTCERMRAHGDRRRRMRFERVRRDGDQLSRREAAM